MDEATSQRLRTINQVFYETRAVDFDQTRERAWTGWENLWNIIGSELPRAMQILDLGCGNGRFGQFMENKAGEGLSYTGVDQSQTLLKIAQVKLKAIKKIELINQSVEEYQGDKADLVAVFGLIHHVPGFEQRLSWLRHLTNLVKSEGFLAISFWRLDINTALMKRRATEQDLLRLGITSQSLETGDYLLPFGISQPDSFRYVHQFNEGEIERYRGLERMKLIAEYVSDGKESRSNTYLIFKKLSLPQEQR